MFYLLQHSGSDSLLIIPDNEYTDELLSECDIVASNESKEELEQNKEIIEYGYFQDYLKKTIVNGLANNNSIIPTDKNFSIVTLTDKDNFIKGLILIGFNFIFGLEGLCASVKTVIFTAEGKTSTVWHKVGLNPSSLYDSLESNMNLPSLRKNLNLSNITVNFFINREAFNSEFTNITSALINSNIENMLEEVLEQGFDLFYTKKRF